jgi:HEAT repeat protein
MLEGETDVETRLRIIEALEELQGAAIVAVPKLLRVLSVDPHGRLRRAAAAAIERIRPRSGDAVRGLESSLGDEDDYVRLAAARALWTVSGKADEPLTVMLSLLRSDPSKKKSFLRGLCAEAIGEMREDARGALPALREQLRSQAAEAFERATTARALMLIDPSDKAPIGVLRPELSQVEWVRRLFAVEYLGDIGPAASETVPDLIRAISDEQISVQWAAIESLGEIGPEARSALPVLRGLLADEDNHSSVRVLTAGALWHIGNETEETVPYLIKFLST